MSWLSYHQFSSYPYSLQEDSSIDGQVISSGKHLCKETNLSPININSHYYVLQKTYIDTIVSLGTIINVDVNVICYNMKDVVPLFLSSISQNCYNTLSPLHISMKEHYIIMYENNQREGVYSEISVSIVTQYTTYDLTINVGIQFEHFRLFVISC